MSESNADFFSPFEDTQSNPEFGISPTPKQHVTIPKEPSFKKAKWTPDEDKLLIDSVKRNGMSNWSLVAKEVPGRTGKQCRERWTNQLCPDLNKDNWTPQEDQILLKQQQINGNFWAKIAKFLPGRSPNAIKNRWSWLSRHRIPAMFAAQMMLPRMTAGQALNPNIPVPQIYQTQQTVPQEINWQTSGSQDNRIPFSEPNIFSNGLSEMSNETDTILAADDFECHIGEVDSYPLSPSNQCDFELAETKQDDSFWDF
ncbi:Myb-like DNA-binding domain containing protein [Trichomonas vaginalis G3]|uniref:Myb-like DNA-binding domain containing protein n=1 Tax=Trichomonas vaginalis (strain ATCC PRA-98 / G3) TaxID=412133 RepID=A2ELH4_TRIV3|nr:RNA polymerase II transcription regulator recruiting protein [Trichomonas vaginalis G3]EAY06501.1 Myb-like DNA-binding domain containing protein [Trichomonas vaginalis G3]KAI5538864.1 RNA polymerase II transcription regulator recruiting protein [Trichomonas vaginalis G3]|eukprot:XP_001318724.1 Myb-like DNA-binding domain containing protein [Trichomonas vaginalis G3]